MDYDFLSPQGGGEKLSENKTIDNILRSGADFIGNQFQAMFYWFDEAGTIGNVFYQHLNPLVPSTLIYNKDNADEKRKQGNFIDGDLDHETKYKQAISIRNVSCNNSVSILLHLNISIINIFLVNY